METHKAARVSITVEKLIQDKVTAIIEEEGAAGYSIFEGGGKGQHDLHISHGSNIVGEFSIVKIEVVVNDHAVANRIAERVATQFLGEQSGIVYVDNVWVLRPQKFIKDD